MTREEQIEQAIDDYNGDISFKSSIYMIERDCFKKGAEWADEHPYWHDLRKDPEDLPKSESEYIVALKTGITTVLTYYPKSPEEKWYDNTGDGAGVPNYFIAAWMPIPKFKED